MKKLLIIIFSLSTTLASLAGHAGSITNIDPLKATSPIVRVATADADYGGSCDCVCTDGTWVCNEPSCGLHGSGCPYADGTSTINKLDSRLQQRTLPGTHTLPGDQFLPGDQYAPLKRDAIRR